MIYLIGGMPRVGKTTLAQTILERNKISWIPLDAVREALNASVPSLKIQEGKDWWVEHHEKFFPFLRELIDSLVITKNHYVLEGDSFIPKQASNLMQEFEIKTCFLGTSKLEAETLKTFKGAGDFWTDNLPKEELEVLPGWIMDFSQKYRLECENLGIKYFDVSLDYKQALEDAYEYLIK
jgi:AAA+ ATPase superfamily predicted ATPase